MKLILFKLIDIPMAIRYILKHLIHHHFMQLYCVETDTSPYEASFRSILCIKKIDSSFLPIRLLTKIIFFQSDRIISWDLWSYRKNFWSERPNMPRPVTEKKNVCKKKWIEWCSHMTFDTKKILQSYRLKHYEESLDNFWAIFDDFLER